MAGPDDIAPILMTRAEYARHRGVSKPMVTKYVEGGKIAVDENGMIDVVGADRSLGETRERINEPARDDDAVGVSKQLTKARAFRESYLALAAKIDLAEKSGKVVMAAGVASAAAECAELALRAVRTLSGRADAAMAAAKDVTSMRAFLRGVEREIHAMIAAGFEKAAAEAASSRASRDAKSDALGGRPDDIVSDDDE